MPTIKLVLEYDGSAYAGWQWQPNQLTIQGMLQQALARLSGQQIEIAGAGRTDAGVHAKGQVASFAIDSELATERYAPGLNFYLPDDIRVLEATVCEPDFHARFSATSRRYRYLIQTVPSVFYRTSRWQHRAALQLALLRKSAELLIGEHDFSPFCVTASLKESNRCIIQSASWKQIGPLYSFEISANRFLHTMVRSLVGSMHNLARVQADNNPQNLTLDLFAHMLRNPTGERSVFTAPAHGLYLMAVGYKPQRSPR